MKMKKEPERVIVSFESRKKSTQREMALGLTDLQ
jgi:hypothetical protein